MEEDRKLGQCLQWVDRLVCLSLGNWQGVVASACGPLEAAQVCDHSRSHYQNWQPIHPDPMSLMNAKCECQLKLGTHQIFAWNVSSPIKFHFLWGRLFWWLEFRFLGNGIRVLESTNCWWFTTTTARIFSYWFHVQLPIWDETRSGASVFAWSSL